MSTAIYKATEAITASLALAAITRIGIPILLALVTWLGGQVLSMSDRIQKLQSGIEAAAARVEKLEKRDEMVAQAQAQARADISGLVATQAATLRAVERIERVLERPTTR